MLLWQAKNLVLLLTTAHEAAPEDKNYTFTERRQTENTATNRRVVEHGWGHPDISNIYVKFLLITIGVWVVWVLPTSADVTIQHSPLCTATAIYLAC